MPMVDRILKAEEKIDSLFQVFGYPTLKKVGDRWVQSLFDASLIHSLRKGRMEYYLENYHEDIPTRTIAFMKDKLSVKNQVPQEYGTQYEMIDGKLKLYPTHNIDSLDYRRAEMRMLPYELYLQDLGYYEELEKKN